MTTPSSYKQVIESSSLQERQVAALESIADSLRVLAAAERHEARTELESIRHSCRMAERPVEERLAEKLANLELIAR